LKRIVVIIQARTTSIRLPRKALLQVAGYPSAILAALRASNREHKTILATSDDQSDNVLASEALKHGIATFRGPLHDVLARYFLAASGLPEDCIVVRLTADNVVPDGEFVDEMAREFALSGVEYLGMDPLLSRMPYGLGGEAFSVAALRNAHTTALSANDREHVGPWMKRNCRSKVFLPKLAKNGDFSHLRCTIDDERDYNRMLRLFEQVTDPLRIGYFELVRRLVALPDEPAFRVSSRRVSGVPHCEMTLGTAQLGMEYGAVNDVGRPSKADAVALVRRALIHGVTALDTARGYGEAEMVLGEAITRSWRSRVRLVTKLHLSGVSTGASKVDVRRAVDESVDSSCRSLGTPRLDTLLLHDWKHYHAWGGAAWHRLLELQQQEKIGVLGASVYDTDDALAALRDSSIGHLQIPVNVLDWRWKAAGVDQAIAQRSDVIVHGRSAFLQGILLHSFDRWPAFVNFDSADCARKLSMLMKNFGRDSLADLCLAYVRSLPWLTSIVVGCETLPQLEENLRLFLRPALNREECSELERALPKAPPELLNPANWNLMRKRHVGHAS